MILSLKFSKNNFILSELEFCINWESYPKTNLNKSHWHFCAF